MSIVPIQPGEPRGDRRDVRVLLRELRAQLPTAPAETDALTMLAGIEEALDRVLIEHAGMSQELLSVYEQLGVVFEVSRRLSAVRGERTVVELFLDSLRRTFHGHEVWVAERGADGSWRCHDPQHAIASWLPDILDRAAQAQRVQVEAPLATGGDQSIAEIMVGPVFSGDAFVCSIVLMRGSDSSAPAFRASDMGLLQSLSTFCGDLIRNQRLVAELRAMSIDMVRALVNAVDQKDEYTSGHSLRVAYFATWIGRELKLAGKELQMLQWSALLHDVGKIGIRDDVLKKAGKLTAEEFDHMKEHPVRSHRVVQQVPQLTDALPGVLHHHERYDGTGYPWGLAGEAIPLQARIVQIADVFDALTSNRSYRAAFPWTKALRIMAEETGKTVDPRLQQLFDGMIRRRLNDDTESWNELVAEANRFADTGVDGASTGDS